MQIKKINFVTEAKEQKKYISRHLCFDFVVKTISFSEYIKGEIEPSYRTLKSLDFTKLNNKELISFLCEEEISEATFSDGLVNINKLTKENLETALWTFVNRFNTKLIEVE